MYEVIKKPNNNSFLAVTNHEERVVFLGREYFKLPKIKRRLVLAHEMAHALDGCDEATANLRAINQLSKETKYAWIELFKFMSEIQKDDEHMKEVLKLKKKENYDS